MRWPGRAPHVAGVDVEPTVVVVVEKRGAHPRAVIEQPRRCSDVLERHRAVAAPEVPVQVLGAEVVRHQQIGPAVAVVIGPGRREMIVVVAGVEPASAVTSTKRPWPSLRKSTLGRAVARVVVRRRRAGLVLAGAEEIGVHAQVQIEKAVTVVVRHRDRRQHALKRLREAEGIGDGREAALAVVDEEQRPVDGRERRDPDRRRCRRRRRAIVPCRRERQRPRRR